MCHNYYQQAGGEDQVFADEAALLESHGHEVIRYQRHNDQIDQMSRWAAARGTVWNTESYHQLRGLMRRHHPDIMHCSNTFALISPAAYYAARSQRVPVVQSLHNYRLLCPNGLFLRNGRACESCLGLSVAWPGIWRRCYRDSHAASAVLAATTSVHRLLGTWKRAVHRYIALSSFSRDKFVQGGLPAERIVVKSNFVHPDPMPGSGGRGYAIAVGRLSAEKGIDTLLQAWAKLPDNLALKIVGDGPLADRVQAAARDDQRIEWLGRRPLEQVYALLGDAAFLVLPSICYENCPKVLIEAYAKGVPVIASRIGSMVEFVRHGTTGLHFEAADPARLVECVQLLTADSDARRRMQKEARREFQAKYTAESNYRILLSVYQQARDAMGLRGVDQQESFRHKVGSRN